MNPIRKWMRGAVDRRVVGALAFSAAGFIGLVGSEYFTDRAVIPIKGDRPTVGFGSTYRDDGSPVQMGDRITVPKALQRTQRHIQKDETKLKNCVTAPLHQREYDFLVDSAYNLGADKVCNSSMVAKFNAGDYAGGCAAILKYKYAAGRDCSVRANRCYGLWLRRQEAHKKCMGVADGLA